MSELTYDDYWKNVDARHVPNKRKDSLCEECGERWPCNVHTLIAALAQQAQPSLTDAYPELAAIGKERAAQQAQPDLSRDREQIEDLRIEPEPPSTDPEHQKPLFRFGRAQWNNAIDAVLALRPVTAAYWEARCREAEAERNELREGLARQFAQRAQPKCKCWNPKFCECTVPQQAQPVSNREADFQEGFQRGWSEADAHAGRQEQPLCDHFVPVNDSTEIYDVRQHDQRNA